MLRHLFVAKLHVLQNGISTDLFIKLSHSMIQCTISLYFWGMNQTSTSSLLHQQPPVALHYVSSNLFLPFHHRPHYFHHHHHLLSDLPSSFVGLQMVLLICWMFPLVRDFLLLMLVHPMIVRRCMCVWNETLNIMLCERTTVKLETNMQTIGSISRALKIVSI